MTATAKAAAGPDKGDFDESLSYQKADVVKDVDGKKYAATSDVGPSATHPKDDTGLLGNWRLAEQKDSAVVAAFVLATGKSQLSGASLIR